LGPALRSLTPEASPFLNSTTADSRAPPALAPANRLAYPLRKRTVAQPDATKRPARMYGGPFCVSSGLMWRICHAALKNALKQLDCNDSH
jgi:hypothetical protein